MSRMADLDILIQDLKSEEKSLEGEIVGKGKKRQNAERRLALIRESRETLEKIFGGSASRRERLNTPVTGGWL